MANELFQLLAHAAETGATDIDLSHKGCVTLPPEIGELTYLRGLWLEGNHLKSVPGEMARLADLRWLNISFNLLEEVPSELSCLKNLEELVMRYNFLTSLPVELGQLDNLQKLDVANNKLSSVPWSFGSLSNLCVLDLSNNQLTEVPSSLGDLSNLRVLNLEGNHLKSIPVAIAELEGLTELKLRGNPLESPPPEVAAKGVRAIQHYFRQTKAEGTDHIYEAKLLIVGEPGAGKTSLTKKILDPKYELQPGEKSTEGIDVVEWHFPMDDGRDFRVNIWDFGGQEIYHATHQFFLTRRSLYTLVVDTRKEDTDFYYWLNVVELLSAGSPLLIVKNEKQDRHREMNESAFKGEFPNIKEIMATNLMTGRGLTAIKTEIRHRVCRLPHVGAELPKTWVKVRESLERDERNYITVGEYLDICEQNGFRRLEDKLQLSAYLHDLGVCLHFQDDDLLNKTVILKPEWGTHAVYRLLDDQKVVREKGRFSMEQLESIWKGPCYTNMHGELVRLMTKFRLCYRVASSPWYIVPELLGRNAPVYPWDSEDNLVVRYVYEFMPKGLIPQFIVAMHPWIAKQDWVWREGVVLKKEESWAEIVENYGMREIRIRVAGKKKKALMTIIMHELDKVNSGYTRLKCDKLIPCNCVTCERDPSPHFYRYEKLQEFAGNGQRTIQCQKRPYTMVDVERLIDEVIEKTPEVGSEESMRFAVALSFPGEQREFVRAVAHELIEVYGYDRVFYDKHFEGELARLNLDTYLQDIYHDESELIVVFLCQEYASKQWCGLEWRAIRDVVKTRRGEAVMPIRFDATHVRGLFSIDGYVDAQTKTPHEIAQLIIGRHGDSQGRIRSKASWR